MPPDLKKIFDQWKASLLVALLRVPELKEAADIIGHGEIILTIANGKIMYVNLSPKMKVDTTAQN